MLKRSFGSKLAAELLCHNTNVCNTGWRTSQAMSVVQGGTILPCQMSPAVISPYILIGETVAAVVGM